MLRPRKIAPFVELFAARTPTLPPATHTNSYALGSRDVLLVEPATPYPEEREAFLGWARRLEADGRRLVALFATHHHPDHTSGARFFADALGLPLWAHAETRDRVAEGVRVDRLLSDGESIDLSGPSPQRWRVLHTPGHAPGHLCLFEADLGVAVVGDMVASEGTILIAPGDGDMAEYLRQLARLQTLGATLALPAHGEPVDDPNALFARYVTHRLLREKRVLSALAARGAAGASEDDLLPEAYADTSPLLFPIAALSMRAHLDKLLSEGRVLSSGGRLRAADGALSS